MFQFFSSLYFCYKLRFMSSNAENFEAECAWILYSQTAHGLFTIAAHSNRACECDLYTFTSILLSHSTPGATSPNMHIHTHSQEVYIEERQHRIYNRQMKR